MPDGCVLIHTRLTYDKDPMQVNSLTPPLRHWPEGVTDEQRADVFDIIMHVNARAAEVASRSGSGEQKQQAGQASASTMSSRSSTGADASTGTMDVDDIEDDDEGDGGLVLSLERPSEDPVHHEDEAQARQLLESGEYGLLSPSAEQVADDTESVLSTEANAGDAAVDHEKDRNLSLWCWEDIPGSETYEMYTVKWETELLLELGSHIFVRDSQLANLRVWSNCLTFCLRFILRCLFCSRS